MFKSRICDITRSISIWSQSSESQSCLPRNIGKKQPPSKILAACRIMPTCRHLPIAAACAISCEQPAIITSQCGHVPSIRVCWPRIGGNIATQIIFRNNFPASNFPGTVYPQTPLLLGAYTTPACVCLLVRGWSLGTRLSYCHKTLVTPLLNSLLQPCY